jgi:Cdc6-like AAA superfamily ATPase
MAIYVKKAIEPGSRQAETSDVILARNDVWERLKRILTRYALGEMTGRSFLISGHRGAGKTTLVRKVVHDVRNELRGKVLPLLVVLPGPALLRDDRPGGAFPETEAVLEQITLNLYRAMARVFADHFAGVISPRPNVLAGKVDPELSRAHEIAADFRLKLDGPVELAELRSLWLAAGRLETGILPLEPPRPGQGMFEIIALWSCLNAYLSLTASNFQQKTGSSVEQRSTSEAGVKTSTEKGVVSALLGAGAGSTVGAALAAGTGNPVLAAFSGVAIAIGSALLLNYSATRSREARSGFESSLTIKRDVASLARELPELIRRCRDAGIVPIFLVDELDKVQGLEQRMETLIRNAKFFVTEQAVFFFITDRSYFEYLEERVRMRAYVREHTFFSERLFVAYRPSDWRQYLRELMLPGSAIAEEQDRERSAIEILSFVLLCRSRMHAIDLRRAIADVTELPNDPSLSDFEGFVSIDPAELLSKIRFQHELLMQVAVETAILADADLNARYESDPRFRQVAYDALYYLAHLWTTAPEGRFQVELTSFSKYLRSRSERVTQLTDADIVVLCRRVDHVRFWLQNPNVLASKAAEYDPLSNISEQLGSVPGLIDRIETGEYIWNYDAYGRKLRPSSVERLRTDELAADIKVIEDVDQTVQAASNYSVRLDALQDAHLLSSSPPAQVVFDAILRLKSLARPDAAPYSEMEEDASHLAKFVTQLRRRSDAIARAITASWLLARASMLPDESARFRVGWSIVADCVKTVPSGLDAADRDAADDQVVRRIFSTLQSRGTTEGNPFLSKPAFDQYYQDAWRESLQRAVDRIRHELGPWALDESDIKEKAWEEWAHALTAFLKGSPESLGKTDGFTFDQLMCAARGIGPGRLLRPLSSPLPILRWSALVRAAARGEAPIWAGVVGLIATGYEMAANSFDVEFEALQPAARELHREALSRFSHPSKRPSVMLIYLPENSIAAHWTPMPKWACFGVPASDLGVNDKLGLPEADAVLIEVDASDRVAMPLSEITGMLGKLGSRLLNPKRQVPIGVIANASISTDVPVIVAPKDIDDAMTRLSRQLAAV